MSPQEDVYRMCAAELVEAAFLGMNCKPLLQPQIPATCIVKAEPEPLIQIASLQFRHWVTDRTLGMKRWENGHPGWRGGALNPEGARNLTFCKNVIVRHT